MTRAPSLAHQFCDLDFIHSEEVCDKAAVLDFQNLAAVFLTPERHRTHSEMGFRATIEETILSGEGRVDVSLVRNGYRVACQVSVTTTKDWELQNVERCLAAGYQEVVLVLSTKFIEDNLDEDHKGRVRYAVPETIPEFLDSIDTGPVTTESEVRGYKVKVTRQNLSPDEIAKRRAAVAGVIARSLKKQKGE